MPVTPRVTVLMPVYNAERYLQPALDSILALTLDDFKFLIINDGLSDGSRKVVESYADPSIKLVDNPRNMGLAKTLNRGLGLAAGDLIARQDADDVSYPQPPASAGGVPGQLSGDGVGRRSGRIIDDDGRPNGLRFDRRCEYESIRWDLLFDNSFTHTSVMFRRKTVAGEMGSYDESFSYFRITISGPTLHPAAAPKLETGLRCWFSTRLRFPSLMP